MDRELTKKFTLMQYFKKYLSAGTMEKEGKKKSEAICYVKQWVKSDNGIIFRLSNKVLQVNYSDKSQLMLYTEHCVGVYSDGSSLEKIFFQLGSPEEKHPLLSKKLDQMKELLKSMRKNKIQKYEVEVNNYE